MRTRALLIGLFLLSASLRAEVRWPARLGKWTIEGPAKSVSLPSDQGDTARKILEESGLVAASTQQYLLGAGSVQATLYSFRDSSGAYEAFTFLQRSNPPAMYAGDKADVHNQHAVVLKGNLVIDIDAGPASHDAQAITALSSWMNSLASKTPPPPIPAYLPDHNLVQGTPTYALGPAALRAAFASGAEEDSALIDAVGFSSGAEAMSASYRSQDGKNHVELLLIQYPTPQLAQQHLKHLEQALPQSAKQAGTTIERKGSLLSIILNPSSTAYAEALRNSVNYETQVTWHEPTHTITDPPITSTIAKIIISTFVLLGVAVVLGVAFGGVRVLTKKFFPGKVFDRPDRMEVLQLGLSGKRIDPSDFY